MGNQNAPYPMPPQHGMHTMPGGYFPPPGQAPPNQFGQPMMAQPNLGTLYQPPYGPQYGPPGMPQPPAAPHFAQHNLSGPPPSVRSLGESFAGASGPTQSGSSLPPQRMPAVQTAGGASNVPPISEDEPAEFGARSYPRTTGDSSARNSSARTTTYGGGFGGEAPAQTQSNALGFTMKSHSEERMLFKLSCPDNVFYFRVAEIVMSIRMWADSVGILKSEIYGAAIDKAKGPYSFSCSRKAGVAAMAEGRLLLSRAEGSGDEADIQEKWFDVSELDEVGHSAASRERFQAAIQERRQRMAEQPRSGTTVRLFFDYPNTYLKKDVPMLNFAVSMLKPIISAKISELSSGCDVRVNFHEAEASDVVEPFDIAGLERRVSGRGHPPLLAREGLCQ